ncbi:DUF6270 domain-containing protein [Brevibacterium casei]|uniref:DUF6270 domain-containing protein n=1 Tax=Brevibacterium TaxID=1696 RepID=UPI002011DFBB|nr:MULTISPECIES: DUF6270 domain-containing protein [Brevibacterium]MCT1767500.1 DUF6270 domain-containing protein [Brevibacterium casei]
MNIAIFGSCVSRDTSEFIPDANVIAYVARHSVTSLETPHGAEGVDLGQLRSSFQKRMVTSDLLGSGLKQVCDGRDAVDLVLIDLVDERRGFWSFPNGTTMTNSLEVEASGAGEAAEKAGARLVVFGSDEHFEAWSRGFAVLVEGLRGAGLWEKTIILDVEWACAVDGALHPQSHRMNKLGRKWRRLQRGVKEANRVLTDRRSIREALTSLTDVAPTEAEVFADRATAANREYVRYRNLARSQLRFAVVRSSSDVRIDRDHKWGPEPFHYRREDYESIVQSISAIMSDEMDRPKSDG